MLANLTLCVFVCVWEGGGLSLVGQAAGIQKWMIKLNHHSSQISNGTVPDEANIFWKASHGLDSFGAWPSFTDFEFCHFVTFSIHCFHTSHFCQMDQLQQKHNIKRAPSITTSALGSVVDFNRASNRCQLFLTKTLFGRTFCHACLVCVLRLSLSEPCEKQMKCHCPFWNVVKQAGYSFFLNQICWKFWMPFCTKGIFSQS